jgi:hypothetical protein
MPGTAAQVGAPSVSMHCWSESHERHLPAAQMYAPHGRSYGFGFPVAGSGSGTMQAFPKVRVVGTHAPSSQNVPPLQSASDPQLGFVGVVPLRSVVDVD